MKLPNFTRPLYGIGEHKNKVSFSFPKLGYGPFGFNPEKGTNICQNQMKLNKIDVV